MVGERQRPEMGFTYEDAEYRRVLPPSKNMSFSPMKANIGTLRQERRRTILPVATVNSNTGGL